MATGHLGHRSTHRTNGHTSETVWWYCLLNANAGYVDFMVGHISLLLATAVNNLYILDWFYPYISLYIDFIVVCIFCVHVTVRGISDNDLKEHNSNTVVGALQKVHFVRPLWRHIFQTQISVMSITITSFDLWGDTCNCFLLSCSCGRQWWPAMEQVQFPHYLWFVSDPPGAWQLSISEAFSNFPCGHYCWLHPSFHLKLIQFCCVHPSFC